MQTVFRYWAWIVFLAVLVQVGFAGYGAFSVAGDADKGSVSEDQFTDAFGPHIGFGYLVVLSGLILLILALVARTRIKHSLILFGLFILQVLLAWFGFEAPVIGFFHPVNALVLFALSGWIAWSSWRSQPAAAMSPPPPAAAA